MTQRLEDRNEPESPIIANIRRGVIGRPENEAILAKCAQVLQVWWDARNHVATLREEERQGLLHPHS